MIWSTTKLNMKSKQFTNKNLVLSPFLCPSQQRARNELSMDWSMDVLEVPTSPQPCVLPAGQHMSLPHVPLGSNGNRVINASNSAPSVLNYSNDQPAIISSWDRVFHILSLFRTEESDVKDAENIQISLSRIINYIKHHPVNKKTLSGEFVPVVKGLWEFVEALLSNKWDIFIFNKEATLSIRKCFQKKIIPYYNNLKSMKANLAKKPSSSMPSDPLPFSKVTSSSTVNTPVVPPSPTKSVESLVKKTSKPLNMKKSYAQASKANILSNIEDVI